MTIATAAAIQFNPELLLVEKNLRIAVQLSFEAAAKGAAIVVLPELCISGNTIQNIDEANLVAQQKNGYQTLAFLPIAQRFNCTIVFGYVELYEGKFYNSAASVGPQGLILNVQKHNLHGSDNLWATPSEQSFGIAMTRAGRLGSLICKDGSNNYRSSYKFYKPEQKFYHSQDIDTVALLTNWGDVYAYPDSSWVDLSESLISNIIVSNRFGSERDQNFKGGCAIIDKKQKIWTFGNNFDAECVVGGLIEF